MVRAVIIILFWVVLQCSPISLHLSWAAVAQAYIRPRASGKEMLLVSRIVVFCFGMFTGVICIILNVVRAPPLPTPGPALCIACVVSLLLDACWQTGPKRSMQRVGAFIRVPVNVHACSGTG